MKYIYISEHVSKPFRFIFLFHSGNADAFHKLHDMFRKESSDDRDKKRKKKKKKKHGTEYKHNEPETNVHENELPEKYAKFIIIHSDTDTSL